MYPAAENALQPLNDKIADVKENLDQVNNKVLAFVKEQPGTCLLAAIAVGYVVGRLAARA